jgi:hypothetical protein
MSHRRSFTLAAWLARQPGDRHGTTGPLLEDFNVREEGHLIEVGQVLDLASNQREARWRSAGIHHGEMNAAALG